MPPPDKTICERCRAEVAPQALFCPMCGQARSARDGDPLLGQVIADRYLLRERIGQGGSGTIYLAEHITVKRKVAVKVLHYELSRDDLAVERFRREATTVAQIDNEHIVEVLDFGRLDDGRLFLAMELLDGETLAAALKREKELPLERSLDILTQVGEALMEAHATGYLHRDLRPGNIFLSRRRGREGFVKVLDFGLSKLVQREGEAANTSLGMTFGDPCYMSPEQARGDLLDRRSDIYALGVMAYEMLTGRPPFVGKKVFDVLTQHIESTPEPPSSLRGEIPEWLDAVVLRALAKRPDERFVTVYRLIEAVREGLTSGATMTDEAARSMPAVEPPPPAPRRRDPEAVEPPPSGPSPSRRVAMAAVSSQPTGLSSAWYEEGEQPADVPLASDSSALLLPPRSRRGLYFALSIAGAGAVLITVVMMMSARRRAPLAQAPEPAPAPAPAPEPIPVPVPVIVSQPAPPAPAPAPAPVPAPVPVPEKPSTRNPPAHAAKPKPAKPAEPPRDSKAPPVFDFRPKPPEPAPAPPDEQAEADDEEAADPAEVAASEAGQADFYVKLGQKALRDGDTATATASFNKARAYDTRNADAIAGLGQVAMKMGQYSDATVHLEAASRLAPNSARIHILRGQAYLAASNREAAAAAFKRALKIDPENQAASIGYREASGE